MIKFNRLLALVMTISTLSLSACTDEEIATGIGIGAVVGGAILIGANTRCEGGYRTECHTYIDYWGHHRSECRQVYDSCAVLRPRFAMETGIAASINENVINEVSFGTTFGLGFDASKRLIDSFRSARAGDLQALKDLGLSKTDLNRLAKFKLPTARGLDSLARTLEQDQAQVRLMLERILQEALVRSKDLARETKS
jgi:hypothetical protein